MVTGYTREETRSEQIWSHPPSSSTQDARFLVDHAENVSEKLNDVFDGTPELSTNVHPRSIAASIAKCHDIGKCTSWFQHDTLNNTNHSRTKVVYGESRHHSAIGAAATWYALRKHGFEEQTVLAAVSAVLSHHSPYPSVDTDVFERFVTNERLWQKVLQEQVSNIDNSAPLTAETLITDATDGRGSWGEFRDLILNNELQPRVETAVVTPSSNPYIQSLSFNNELRSTGLYVDILRLWSALTHADTLDAAEVTVLPQSPHPNTTLDAIETHIQALPDTDSPLETTLNELRENCRKEAVETATTAENPGGVFSISLPTGLGKTLTGMSAAITLRNRKTNPGPVIYALPYTSIIDQTVKTFEDVFQTTATEDHLTTHHYLSDTRTSIDQYTNRNEILAGESWLTDITVTTFVQLFESMSAPVKRQSYKLPRLHNSVIILDEPHLLPMNWWPVVNVFIDLLVSHFNATVILMTATQPTSIKQKHDTNELVAPVNPPTSRVSYRLHESLDKTLRTGLPTTDAAGIVAGEHEPDTGSLVVCNTINSVREFYKKAIDQLSTSEEHDYVSLNELLDDITTNVETNGIDSLHDYETVVVDEILESLRGTDFIVLAQLTTRLRPIDRRIIIRVLQDLEIQNISRIVISTQLIEAGVDLSFKRVYRDIAPIDAVVQAAGRCNRGYEHGDTGGELTLWQLHPDDATRLPAMIYTQSETNANLLNITFTALSTILDEDINADCETMIVSEGEMRESVEEYHGLLADRLPDRNALVDDVESVNTSTLQTASMVGESHGNVQICIPQTQLERDIVSNARDAFDSTDYGRGKSLLQQLQQFTVSVPVYDEENREKLLVFPRVHDDVDIFFVQHIDSVYSPKDGFVIPESTVHQRFR